VNADASPDDPTGRFAVPAELLRLARDPTDRGEQARGTERRPDQGGRSPGAAVRPAALAARTCGAAATAAIFTGARVAAPHLERSLHVGDTGTQAVLAAALIAGLAGSPMAGRIADRKGHARVGTAALAVATGAGALTAAAPDVSILAALLAVLGVATGGLIVADLASLAATSSRAVAGYLLGFPGGVALGAAIAGSAVSIGGSWRWAMLVSLLGVPAVAARVRQPAGDGDAGVATATAIAVQRVRRLQSLVGLLAVASVVGFALVGAPLIAAAVLRHHWHQTLAQRGPALMVVALGAIAGLPVAAVLGDRAWRKQPRLLMPLAGSAMAAFGVFVAAGASMPRLWLAEVAWMLAVAMLAVVTVVGTRAVLVVAPSAVRATTLGLFGAYGLLLGGVGATVVLAAVAQANGARLALVLAAPATLAGAAVTWGSGRRFEDDVAVAAEEASRAAPRGGRCPALEIRNLSFSYGSRQVLFGVSLQIEDGEVAALLGANGAGKSTLLRLVAGLDHPSSGAIAAFGRETTYAEAEQQIAAGIAMLSGGHMSFPGMTVIENLRVGCHTLRRDGRRLQAAIDEVSELFPVLAERRDQRVGTLSGGEQQMLALGRVLLTRPRLLLIDELSLGLAPKAVEQLLAIVRRVNEQGTTVLLVEQSVNLAFSLARRALFLERGEVRFDGDTADLLERGDLLRPVFLSAPSG
jgi:ABC-type branched-subunit amino acid transport system ATPase component